MTGNRMGLHGTVGNMWLHLCTVECCIVRDQAFLAVPELVILDTSVREKLHVSNNNVEVSWS